MTPQQNAFTLPGARPSYAPDLALEPTHVEARLAFDIQAETVSGSATHTLLGRRAGARSLRLEAVGLSELAVEGLEDEALSWRYDGERVEIDWERGFEIGEERRVRVSYRAVRPISGVLFSHPEPAYPRRPLFLCTDHETERARYWLPCVDFPAVRTTWDLHLTVDASLTAVAGGLLQGETDNGDGTRTAHWRLEHPCPSYLLCVAAGRLVRHDAGEVDGRELAWFAVEGTDPAWLARSFSRTAEMMRWLEKRLGNPYPFAKYYQIAVPEIGGAMENLTLVSWDEIYLLDEELARERQWYVDAINLHEMSHGYFGDSLVIRHFEHAWLKESWAVYMETVWWEETEGPEMRDFDLYNNAKAYFGEVKDKYARPLVTRTYDSSWSLFDKHTYPGGAWRIHMLRRKIGEEAFWSAVHDYLDAYRGRVVETEDFRRVLEAHSGLNLLPFFDQWVYAPGHPALKVAFRHAAERDEGVFTVEQTQVDDEKGIGLFRFPLDVCWRDAAGDHRVRIEMERERHEATVPVEGEVLMVTVDPEQDVLCSLELEVGEERLLVTLREAPTVAGRIQAARELIRGGRRRALEAVGEAMLAEPFWGVRRAVAELLGEDPGAETPAPLAGLLLTEEDPRVRIELAGAAGALRDERLRAALLEVLDRDGTPMARAAAYESLGAQRGERDFERILAGLEEASPHGLIRAGALRGLGKLRSVRAFEVLRGLARCGADGEATRPAAVGALAESARSQEGWRRELAREALIDLTRDPRTRVRMQAAEGLAALGSEGSEAIRALVRVQPHQDRPKLERLLEKQRAGRPGEEFVALRGQLEKLEERCRQLDRRLQSVEGRPG